MQNKRTPYDSLDKHFNLLLGATGSGSDARTVCACSIVVGPHNGWLSEEINFRSLGG